MAIASPTTAPEKREGRPNLVICRVCARHRDGFNSTLGVKAKATQFQLPPNSVFAEKSPKKKKSREGFMSKVFPARTLQLQLFSYHT